MGYRKLSMAWFVVSVSIILLLLILFFQFKKSYLSFKLLKRIFPKRFAGYKTYWHFIFSLTAIFEVGIKNYLNITLPWFRLKGTDINSEQTIQDIKRIKKSLHQYFGLILFFLIWALSMTYLKKHL